ncbi:ankyrin repeat domain-containing protein [Maribacter sp. ACAM166]|uniref:ankyrin repeat domain-containing protein n=1 Tax=Maribacter sp. ACAM166 TaxID=2508996 RepID=UPI0010FF56AF|nr:ankyrin repeat domain-containing protein [Maribacter sp. ACAM166]TLP80972.1 ankyrin repeat domain-containing protein [Maribacter sp. ACAM166]
MRKTILTLAMVVLTMGSNLMANETNEVRSTVNKELIKKIEINSFCKAVMQGDVLTVKRLIDLGEDVNQKSLGMTPVMFAARYNKVEVLRLLINHGADLKIKSNQGFSVKRYAELSNATEASEVIETASGI